MLVSTALLAALSLPTDSLHARELLVPTPQGHSIAAVIETGLGSLARPTVVLISGAGPHDRDGYTLTSPHGHNDAFRQLSARFVALGFAVVRFDKVGTGASTGDYARSATTATLAADVTALVAALRLEPEVDPGRIVLLGHSEGGAIAGIVAAADPCIAGVALLAAPAWTGRRIMEYQLRYAAERQVRTVSYTSADLIEAILARDSRERAAADPWYRHFLDYDPLPVMERVRAPVLVLQGARDDVVIAEQGAEIAAALRRGGNGAVRHQVLPGYTHSFTEAAGGVREPSPLAEEVIALLEDWLITSQRR